jgi:hypothetical protein
VVSGRGAGALGIEEDVEGTGGVAEDGRDQPEPVAEDGCGPAVSLVVTRREWDVAGWTVGLASSLKITINRTHEG